MTNDQINKAIAEELGWKPKREDDGWWSMAGQKGNYVGKNWREGVSEDHCWKVCNLDFCNDYNAVAEMREAIRPKERLNYTAILLQVVVPEHRRKCYDFETFDLINATPRQQCEAFLKMRGKWGDHVVRDAGSFYPSAADHLVRSEPEPPDDNDVCVNTDEDQ